MFDCKRCGVSFEYETRLLSHLNRKFTCKPVLEDVDVDSYKNSIIKMTRTVGPKTYYICEYCKLDFNSILARTNHQKSCKSVTDVSYNFFKPTPKPVQVPQQNVINNSTLVNNDTTVNKNIINTTTNTVKTNTITNTITRQFIFNINNKNLDTDDIGFLIESILSIDITRILEIDLKSLFRVKDTKVEMRVIDENKIIVDIN